MAVNNRRSMLNLLWIITSLVLVLMLTRQLMPTDVGNAVLVGVQTIFTLLHGSRRYGWRGILAYYAVTLVVSNALENLSILTGFPFGHYHYTSDPKLFLVPLVVGPFYAVTGYLAWIIGEQLIGAVRRSSDWLTTVGTPVIASFAMVLWDVAMDPTRATVENLWIWEDSGGYFGVPLVNFLGWSLTTYLFLQLFALYLRYFDARPTAVPESSTASSVQALLLYAGTAAAFVITFLTADRTTVTDALGYTWRTGDIYETAALTSIYGMVFVSILAAFSLARRHVAGRAVIGPSRGQGDGVSRLRRVA